MKRLFLLCSILTLLMVRIVAADTTATTNAFFATNTIVTETDGRLTTNRIAMTNIIIMKAVVKDVSTNNGVVLTRTTVAFSPHPASDYDSVHDGQKTEAKFSGGDGSSVKDAIVITANSEEVGIRGAYIWLHEHYPGSHLQDEGSDFDDAGSEYLETMIVTADGQSHTVFFETTSFYGK